MFFKSNPPPKKGGAGLLPVLPLRDLVVFPHMVAPLVVGRPRSRAALQAALGGDRQILLVTQRSADAAEPGPEDVHEVAILAKVLASWDLPDDCLKVHVEGLRRVNLLDWQAQGDFVRAIPEEPPEPTGDQQERERLRLAVQEAFQGFAKVHQGIPPEMVAQVGPISDPQRLADTLAAHLPLQLGDRLLLLNEWDVVLRLQQLLTWLQAEVELLGVEEKHRERARRQSERAGRDAPEGPAAQERDEHRVELDQLAQRLVALNLPPLAREKCEREVRKLRSMNPLSAEAGVLRSWLEQVAGLPWSRVAEEDSDPAHAKQVLAEDHFGLAKVKARILEHLAVAALVGKPPGVVLCLVGPPGVGKTSLARSIARATGRPFVRQALGGVRDEAEIRGHRRTYIGAMPGRIIAGMRRAGAANPVFLLDEIDKMSVDFRGDPAAALLEVLDPEQASTFQDHYLELDYDLSKVFFVCTANDLAGIPAPLQDRLEIIFLPGYTDSEKLTITRRYLLPRQMKACGLKPEQLRLGPGTLARVVADYSREAGVRGLERHIGTLCRKAARRVHTHGSEQVARVRPQALPRLLGPGSSRAPLPVEAQVGVVMGLAVTPWGGEALEIELSVVPGRGRIQLTGRLGDWLKESAQAGLSFVRSQAHALNLPTDFGERVDIHIHYPGNALRTDGPSAGIAMATALVSALCGVPVRPGLAMTGEVSLRGRVLPIGGLREKVLAAARLGVHTVIHPARNAAHVGEIPPRVRVGLGLIAVERMEEVLEKALLWPEGRAPRFLPLASPDWNSPDWRPSANALTHNEPSRLADQESGGVASGGLDGLGRPR